MKRRLYIALFVLLGFLVQAFVHAALEIAYIILLWKNYAAWSFGLSYQALLVVHHLTALALLLLGLWYGYRQGVFWWNYLYQPDGKLKPKFAKAWRL